MALGNIEIGSHRQKSTSLCTRVIERIGLHEIVAIGSHGLERPRSRRGSPDHAQSGSNRWIDSVRFAGCGRNGKEIGGSGSAGAISQKASLCFAGKDLSGTGRRYLVEMISLVIDEEI